MKLYDKRFIRRLVVPRCVCVGVGEDRGQFCLIRPVRDPFTKDLVISLPWGKSKKSPTLEKVRPSARCTD